MMFIKIIHPKEGQYLEQEINEFLLEAIKEEPLPKSELLQAIEGEWIGFKWKEDSE